MVLVEEGWRFLRRRCEVKMPCDGDGRDLNSMGNEGLYGWVKWSGLERLLLADEGTSQAPCGGDRSIGAVHDCGSRFLAASCVGVHSFGIQLIQAEPKGTKYVDHVHLMNPQISSSLPPSPPAPSPLY